MAINVLEIWSFVQIVPTSTTTWPKNRDKDIDAVVSHVIWVKTNRNSYRLASSGPYGPSSLAPATQDKMHPFIIIQWSWFVQLMASLLAFVQHENPKKIS